MKLIANSMITGYKYFHERWESLNSNDQSDI